MAQTRRDRKLGRWRRETAYRSAPLDEVPAAEIRSISIPASDVPASQLPVNADSAALAIAIRDLRRRLRRARWIPWQRRRRPKLQSQIDELLRQWRKLRATDDASARRL